MDRRRFLKTTFLAVAALFLGLFKTGRKAYARWTFENAASLRTRHHIMAERELMEELARNICEEIDLEILGELQAA